MIIIPTVYNIYINDLSNCWNSAKSVSIWLTKRYDFAIVSYKSNIDTQYDVIPLEEQNSCSKVTKASAHIFFFLYSVCPLLTINPITQLLIAYNVLILEREENQITWRKTLETPDLVSVVEGTTC